MVLEKLTLSQRQELLSLHRTERDKRIADRIKSVLLYDDGMNYAEISRVLFISGESVRLHMEDYAKSAKLDCKNGGSASFLNAEQATELRTHLETHLYIRASEICAYVLATYQIDYSVSGMTDWLNRNGFSFHKPHGVPAKSDPEKQKLFVKLYNNLMKFLSPSDHVLFLDSVHPTHKVRFTAGWIRIGKRKEIPTNGSQKRLNIIGALDLEKMTLETREFETINAQSIIEFFMLLLVVMPFGIINIILDQAGYHTSKEVSDWIALNPRIKLHFLPTYSPNLNIIERVWKIMHENTTNNQYYATFKQFTEAIDKFLKVTFKEKAKNWTERLTDNFGIIGEAKV